VSDLIDREGATEITATDASSMYLIFNRMVRDNSTLKMRLSLVRYMEDDETHVIEWSTHCGYEGIWTADNVQELADQLPQMADLDTLIIVETSKDYVPSLNTGWLSEDHQFNNLIFTRPRFAPTVRGNVSPNFCQQDDQAVGVAPGA